MLKNFLNAQEVCFAAFAWGMTCGVLYSSATHPSMTFYSTKVHYSRKEKISCQVVHRNYKVAVAEATFFGFSRLQQFNKAIRTRRKYFCHQHWKSRIAKARGIAMEIPMLTPKASLPASLPTLGKARCLITYV